MTQTSTRNPSRGLLFAVFLALLGAGNARAQDDEGGPLLRQQYLYSQRAYPFERVPPGALQRARHEMERIWGVLRPARNQLAPAAAAEPGIWLPIGPGTIENIDAGRLTTIAIDPRNTNVIYVGAAQGGVWKTTNGGGSWQSLTDAECSLAMGSIALDPVNPDIVYAGTGELHFSGDSYYGCGVLRSTNGGASWTQLGGSIFDTNTGGARISKIIVDRTTAGSTTATTLYASTSFGVFRSVNSGQAWTLILGGVATDLVVHPNEAATFYTAIGTPGGNTANGIYRTMNGGAIWEKLAGNLPTSEVGRIALAISSSAPNVLYAAIQNAIEGDPQDGQLLGIWKTTDGGTNWQQLSATSASCGDQCWYNLVIAVHPQNPDTVYFGGVSLYRSIDGGFTFGNVTSGTHVDQHALSFFPNNPSTMLVGNDGGIYRSVNAGTSWSTLNTNLAITQFYSGVSLHPEAVDNVLGGTQDNGTLEYLGVPSWDRVVGADGGYTAIDFRDGLSAYAETQWTAGSSFGGPRRRDGTTGPFVRKVTGIVTADRGLFIPPMVMDPINSSVLYFGTFRLYRTANRGELWAAVSPDLSRGSGAISSIAPAPSDSLTWYVGTSDGNVQVTTNAGGSWTLRNTGLPNRFITDIAVSPTDARLAIATVSGFGTGHVFRTSDGGSSWQNISGNLPDMPVNAVLFTPHLGNQILIGTDLGVFVSVDGGNTWSPFAAGFPNVAVFDLVYNPFTARIVAVTHGRGAFAFHPVLAERVVVGRDSLAFSSLGDTTRLNGSVFAPGGAPINAAIFWRALNSAVVTVDQNGLVSARGNGTTGVVAAVAGRADTVSVHVRQIVVAVTGLADSTELVVGESGVLPGNAVDARGMSVGDAMLLWTSSNPAVMTVDVAGRFTAHAAGRSTLRVQFESFHDSTRVGVQPPSVAQVDARGLGVRTLRSIKGARFELLRVGLRVNGIEAVDLRRLGFELTGKDESARFLLVHDTDRDGLADESEPILANLPAPLRTGETRTVLVQPSRLVIAGRDSVSLIVLVETSGSVENGTAFRARFNPADTRTINLRSGRADLLAQPSGPVAGDLVTATVLADAEAVSLSENPVRSARVVFNFAARPRVAGIYTLRGRRIVDLLTRSSDARVEWNLTNDEGVRVAPGVYLLVFEIGGQVVSEKLVLAHRDED